MPVCEKHGRYIPTGQHCGACWSEGAFTKKVEAKSSATKFKKPTTKSGQDRAKLKMKLQSLWSKHMKSYYQERGLYHCWITGKTSLKSGIHGMHVSHYFPKGVLWQLWTVPENSGICTYDQNVNKPETVGMMRSKMVKVWGELRIKELEEKAEYHKRMMAIGAEPKRPPEEWLLANIHELKRNKTGRQSPTI